MMNLRNITDTIKIPTFLFILTLFFASITNAQLVNERSNVFSKDLIDYDIKVFKLKRVENTLYFKFLILENSDKVNYVLEVSMNGMEYTTVQFKEGFQSPNDLPLAYYYAVEINTLGDQNYRIRRASDSGDNFSEVINFNNTKDAIYTVQKDGTKKLR